MNPIICQKLRIENFVRKAIIDCPADIDAFEGIAHDTQLRAGSYDFILYFVFTLDQFRDRIMDIIAHNRLNPDGMVYFTYPKKGNRKYEQYIGRDDFFTIIDMNAEGYVAGSRVKFNKMVALDDTFTVIGLKHTVRSRSDARPPRCVTAFADRLPDIEAKLTSYPDAYDFFQSLTPGYRRGWAQYVYGVRSEAIQEKHFLEMVRILRAGHKSINLYRRARKAT